MRKTAGVYQDVRDLQAVFSGISQPGGTSGSKESIMVEDHLSDMVARIKNGYRADFTEVEMASTKLNKKFADVLAKSGYIESAEEKSGKLIIGLKYINKKPAIMGMKRVSKSGARIYSNYKNLPKVWGGLGINILSTPKGIMSDRQAKKAKLGGEILAAVW